MSHKEKMNRHIKGLVCLAFSVLCYSLMFCFIDYDWAFVFLLLLSFLGLGMIVFIYTRKPDNASVFNLLKTTVYENPMSLDEIKKAYHYDGLDNISGKILKLFYNSDDTKRCVVVQESNGVKITFEEIVYHDDESKIWTYDFAYWQPLDESNGSLYADAELAIKDNSDNLKNYHEEKYTQVRTIKYGTEIWWKIDLTSPLIPFASYNKFDLVINGKIVKDATIHNTHWFDKNTSTATISMTDDIQNSFRFKVLHNGEIIATGKHYRNDF